MEKPNINDKKYTYFNKKMGKKMFNNKKYLEDCLAYEKSLSPIPQQTKTK